MISAGQVGVGLSTPLALRRSSISNDWRKFGAKCDWLAPQLPVAIGLFMFEQVNLFTDCFSIGEYSDTGWASRRVKRDRLLLYITFRVTAIKPQPAFEIVDAVHPLNTCIINYSELPNELLMTFDHPLSN